MNRCYDIIETLLDGSTRWRACVVGYKAAVAKMQKFEAGSPNQFHLEVLPTKAIVAGWKAKKDAGSKS